MSAGRPKELPSRVGRPGPRSLDLRGRRLAVAWDDRLDDGRLRSRVQLLVLGGRARTLASVTSRNGTRRHRSLGFNGDVLSWAGQHLPGLGPRVAIRYNLSNRSRRILVTRDRRDHNPAESVPLDRSLFGSTARFGSCSVASACPHFGA